MSTIRAKERDVQRAILDYLEVRRIFSYRNNSGAFVFPKTSTSKRRFFKAGTVGGPDIVCVIDGKYIGIEVKGSGGRQSDAQKDFQQRLEAAGGVYILAFSVEDVHAALA